uniref:HAT C-terminal dimerisation domain-containing protein n=1 Tax=Timema shepardi TaxID=629360 RepID=A0A7R9FXD1_TIMSH|nr:unnamed protein product [Timema shepardi]
MASLVLADSSQLTSDSQHLVVVHPPRVPRSTNPYIWWREEGSRKYPNVSKLALKYLGIPATSVCSERVFSSSGNIVTASEQRRPTSKHKVSRSPAGEHGQLKPFASVIFSDNLAKKDVVIRSSVEDESGSDVDASKPRTDPLLPVKVETADENMLQGIESEKQLVDSISVDSKQPPDLVKMEWDDEVGPVVKAILNLVHFVDTRWSIEYNMLSRFHAIRKAFGAELANSENSIEVLTAVEWKQAVSIVEVIGPLADATKEIINTLAIEVKKLSDISSLEPNVRDEQPSCSSSSSGLWSSFDSISNTTQPAVDNNSEVKDYLNEPRVPRSTNPYIWWREEGSQKYPNVSKVALKYLGIPATSVCSERVFSSSENIVTARQELLTPIHVEELTFLQNNLKRK